MLVLYETGRDRERNRVTTPQIFRSVRVLSEESETQRETERDREKQRETERDREKQRETERERARRRGLLSTSRIP